MKTSLVIATYNRPDALELVLLSVLKQTIMPDEILIADDGSTIETQDLIKLHNSKFQTGIKHVWQKDKGFRKTSILNKSVYKSIHSGKTCIFLKNISNPSSDNSIVLSFTNG